MQPEQVVTNNQGQRFSTDNAELVELRSNQNENRTQGASQVLLPKIEQQETTQSVIQFTQAPQQANQQEPELEGLNTQNNNIHEGAVTDDRLNIDNEVHTRMSQQELINLINKRFNEVKRSSTIYKYYTKILFQILIYISTILELIFTLLYGKQNNISDEPVYEGLYYFSIALTVLLHVYVWIYTYKYMNVQRHHLCWDLLNYVYYAIIGGLSYIKLLPFFVFYSRDKSIQQFSFSQINKQIRKSLWVVQEKKQTNKYFQRLNIPSYSFNFDDDYFPNIINSHAFIQGFYNAKVGRGNDYNNFNYFLLVVNILYYLTELQFIVFTTTYRQITVDIQERLHKIGIQKIQETKQLLKADESYLENVQSFYFLIDTSKFSEYEKRRCIIQIIKFILRLRFLKLIAISNIDSYQPITLQYLANAFECIESNKIILCYKNSERLDELNNTFSHIQGCEIVHEDAINLGGIWNNDQQEETQGEIRRTAVQVNTNRQSNIMSQITGQRNRRISTIFYLMAPDQLRPRFIMNDALNRELMRLEQDERERLQSACNKRDSLEEIRQENDYTILHTPKLELLREQLGCLRRLADCYDYYERIKTMNVFQGILQTIVSLLNLTFQIMQYVYFIQVEKDGLIWALIILQILNPILQLISFIMFYAKLYRNSSIYQMISAAFLFFIFNLLKIWDLVIKIIFLCFNEVIQQTERRLLAINVKAYIRFKSYAAKFKGSIGIVVFNYHNAQLDPNSLWDISRAPTYQAIIWRTSVDEALNKIPQFFIYILTVNKDYAWGFSIVSSVKDGFFAVKDLLAVVTKDFFVPALILRKVSVDQFFQSMSYLSSTQQSTLIEYPKSYAIISKLDRFILNKRKYKIDFTKLDYSYFENLRKKKLQAQLKLVLVNIASSIEIEKAQEFLYLGEVLIPIFQCLQVSELQQLKLNFQLDEIAPENLWLINIILLYCPKNSLKQLEIRVETRRAIYLNLEVERKKSLTAFCYSYYQIREMIRQNRIQNAETIIIDKQFLKLDRYDFSQFYLEVGGNLDLQNCQSFFNLFTNVQTLEIALQSDSADQTFSLQKNIQSKSLTQLSLNFENIQLNTQGYSLSKLKEFKLTLINCRFDKQDLQRLLLTMSQGHIILNLRQALVRNCERQSMERSMMRSQRTGELGFTDQEFEDIDKQLSRRQVKISILL
ncbi:unnamed protein product (macronuclear) [Paramecium tetraurelia]|uniref:Transmembrane protein n=1 Tax=Paramecium tetraurelia TaxID=5888 RepID=A0D359_PARTE|nr:uncharacterized protein GSPATT00012961001 [Paramecium tetraurelia]CAK77476.1 unnamed protein product [Paramecium tetraurelia]|eukprot:XP_001444873.1 hypothetical protein (macronuclear) [Paramecium tetraurelia strain d4-2]